jgi:hypothetical protein
VTAAAPDDGIEAPPAHVNVPARDGSLLRAVNAVAARVGRAHDPAQQLAVDVLTSSWADGRPASLEAAVVCPRQNLKTFCLENIVLTAVTAPGSGGLVVWSAHEVATAQETFRTFLDLAERYPWLGSRITHVSRATGREGIEFRGGRRLRFRARIKTGGRGLAGDLIVLDEAFALEPAHMGSLLPILSTRPQGRVIYGSSAPLAQSDILRRLIARGRAGGPGAPAYLEWRAPGSLAEPGCADEECLHEPGTDGCSLDNEARVLAANPAAVYGRISREYLRGERLALPPLEFARERLGWGEDPATAPQHPLDPFRWALTTVTASPDRSMPVFYVTVGPDDVAVIAVAADRPAEDTDRRPHVELADRVPLSALPDRLEDLGEAWPDAKFAAGKAGPVAGLAEAGLPVTMELLPPSELAQACRHHETLTRDRGYTHFDDPDIATAFAGAVAKPAGDGLWLWDWRKSRNLAPIAAVTGALWLLHKYRSGDYDPSDSFG